MNKPKRDIDDALRGELEAIAASQGCELVHVELKGGVLRLVIDRPEGVSVDDCALVSRQASALLDVADFDPGRYTLEVSSPGLDRPLYRADDYGRFTGRLARVTFRDEETPKRTVVARIGGYEPADGGSVTLRDEETGETFELPLERILAARLEVEL